MSVKRMIIEVASDDCSKGSSMPYESRLHVCGSDICPKGGGHEWGVDMVDLDERTASVVCKKCGMDKLSYDMWTAP